NAELQDRWGLDSGSDVHRYLESHLKDYYYRDENSMIRATAEARRVVGRGPKSIQLPKLEFQIVQQLAGPDEDPQSVVSVLHDLQAAGTSTSVDDVRSALRSLEDKGIVEVVQRTVPTFRLSQYRDDLDVVERDGDNDMRSSS
ncbi:MAG: DUF5797 family protein, partial [Halobacteriaceae archaeon]